MKKVCGWLIAAGFILLLGTAGMSDTGQLDGAPLFWRLAVSLGLLLAGFVGGLYIENREEKRHEQGKDDR